MFNTKSRKKAKIAAVHHYLVVTAQGELNLHENLVSISFQGGREMEKKNKIHYLLLLSNPEIFAASFRTEIVHKSDPCSHILALVTPDSSWLDCYQKIFIDKEIHNISIRCPRTIFGIQRTSQSKRNNSDFYIMLKHHFFIACYIIYFHWYLIIAEDWKAN